MPNTKEEAGAFQSWISLVKLVVVVGWGTPCLPLPPYIAFNKENLISHLPCLHVEKLMRHGTESSARSCGSQPVSLT